MGKPIEIQIWPDKIEILSFPCPVPPITAKLLAENRRIVARDYRNRRVGDFLKELHLTEGRGTGIPTIYRVMEDNGSPPPVIETDEQCTYFLTVLPFNYQFTFQESKISDQDSDQDSDQIVRLLKYALKAKSREELLSHLGLKNHFDNYKRHIEPIIDRNWLGMTIPDKPNSRNQRYITTATGRSILENNATK